MTEEVLRIIVEVKHEDGWTTARALLGKSASSEICRMVTPPRGSTEIDEKFHGLAFAIISSIIREENPDAKIDSRIHTLPRSGHG